MDGPGSFGDFDDGFDDGFGAPPPAPSRSARSVPRRIPTLGGLGGLEPADGGRMLPPLGGMGDFVERAPLGRAERTPCRIALMLPAVRTDIGFAPPAGVRAYEVDPSHGVRRVGIEEAFWDPSDVPQKVWVWAFATPDLARGVASRFAGFRHLFVPFYRGRAPVPQGLHPLQVEGCRRYLTGYLQRTVAELAEGR